MVIFVYAASKKVRTSKFSTVLCLNSALWQQFLFKLSLYNKLQRYLSAQTEWQSKRDWNHIEKKKQNRDISLSCRLYDRYISLDHHWRYFVALYYILAYIMFYHFMASKTWWGHPSVRRKQQSILFHSSKVSPCFLKHCLRPADNILQETIYTQKPEILKKDVN